MPSYGFPPIHYSITCYDDEWEWQKANAEEAGRVRRQEAADDATSMRHINCSMLRLLHVPLHWYIRSVATRFKAVVRKPWATSSLDFPNPKCYGGKNIEFTCKAPGFVFGFCVWDKLVIDVEMRDAFGLRRQDQRHQFLLTSTSAKTRREAVRRLTLLCPVIDWEPLLQRDSLDVDRLDVAMAAFRRVLLWVIPGIVVRGVKEQESARTIQRVWRRVITDPSFLVCRKRLLWEFEN